MSILSDQYILHIIFYISWYLDSTQLQMERWQSQIKLKKLKSIIVSGIILMASLRGVFKLMLSSLPLIGWSFRYPIDLDHRQASFNLKAPSEGSQGVKCDTLEELRAYANEIENGRKISCKQYLKGPESTAVI